MFRRLQCQNRSNTEHSIARNLFFDVAEIDTFPVLGQSLLFLFLYRGMLYLVSSFLISSAVIACSLLSYIVEG